MYFETLVFLYSNRAVAYLLSPTCWVERFALGGQLGAERERPEGAP